MYSTVTPLIKGKGIIMNIIINDQAKEIMESKGILLEDVQDVLEYSESEMKLTDEGTGRNLGKKRMNAVTVYVEYTVDGSDVTVENVYSHIVGLNEDN